MSEETTVGKGVRHQVSAGDLRPGQRWTASRKREAVLRLLRGESVDHLSRELGVEIYRLEEWREHALSGMEVALKARRDDPLAAELSGAMKRVGELTMENELLYRKIHGLETGRPLPVRRSRR